jgi:hypothetical protein
MRARALPMIAIIDGAGPAAVVVPRRDQAAFT